MEEQKHSPVTNQEAKGKEPENNPQPEQQKKPEQAEDSTQTTGEPPQEETVAEESNPVEASQEPTEAESPSAETAQPESGEQPEQGSEETSPQETTSASQQEESTSGGIEAPPENEEKPGEQEPVTRDSGQPEKEKSPDEPEKPGENEEPLETSGETEGEDHDDEELEEEEPASEEEIEASYDKLSREELVSKLEELVQEDNINTIKTRVALIKVTFHKLNKEAREKRYNDFLSDGGNAEDFQAVEDEVETRFNQAFNIYKEKKARHIEEQEKVKQANLEEKKKILEELKELINSEESLKKTYDDFRDLQERWKHAGMVPKAEVNNLWQNYHFLVEKFFDKVKINKELRDLDMKKNLEAKVELCEKAEELLIESSITKSFKELQKLHDKWREIGPVPRDQKDNIWERFKATSDKINQRRREYFAKMREEQEKNLASKAALCEKAEQLLEEEPQTIKEWQKKTDEINELLRIWKSIGRVPKKHNEEIWNRFKAYLDTFFSNKKVFFNKIKQQQLENYNLKLDLTQQAEALKDSTDWKNATRDLINLQKEWKKIGPVPRKHSDKIWKRFRAACDEFFNRKQDYFSNINEREAENLKIKRELIDKVKNFELGEDRKANLDALKEFQRQWMEVGYVPIKEKDKVQQQFREAINEQFERLKVNAVEARALNYQTHLESIRESKDSNEADRILNKERKIIQNKISKLEEDLQLWENNIGFLANSKNANVLKQEFEQKIDKARQELKTLKAKLKVLRTTRNND
ncbi:MAG: DUF349 domain-containing protein [Bacteroidales bacterium]|nr:DUF349 domain-containing protein [Bacteroidales bacterium]